MKKQLFLPAVLLLLLNACSDGTDSKPGAQPAEKPYKPWKNQMESLDKARDLEGQMQQDAKDRDKHMREQGG